MANAIASAIMTGSREATVSGGVVKTVQKLISWLTLTTMERSKTIRDDMICKTNQTTYASLTPIVVGRFVALHAPWGNAPSKHRNPSGIEAVESIYFGSCFRNEDVGQIIAH